MDWRPVTEFEKAASRRPHGNMVGELWHFLRTSQKYWLLPILLFCLLFGVLIFMIGTAAAPFIYTMF